MKSECIRIADQLRRAFAGDAWHGPPLYELISGVTAAQAFMRPISSAHTIWELVTHIDMYTCAAFDAIAGTPMPKWYGTEEDWPAVTETSEATWAATVDRVFAHAERLANAISDIADTRLPDTVPGRDYSFYYLFHGIVQHSLYHGGQIAMLKKAVS